MAFVGTGTLHGSGTNMLFAVGLEESAYGTAAAAEMWAGLATRVEVGNDFGIYEHRGITNIRTLSQQVLHKINAVASITGEVDCGVPFAMGLGAISSTTDPDVAVFGGAANAAGTDQFDGLGTDVYLPSWSILLEYDEATDENIAILGAVCNTATYSCDLEGPMTYTLDFLAKTANFATGVTGATNETGTMGSWNCTVSYDDGVAAYVAAEATLDGLKNIGFTVNHNLRTRADFASTAIRQPTQGFADCELRLTRGFIDDDFWTEICDGTVHSFNFTMTDGTNTSEMDFDSCFCKSIRHSSNLDDQSEEVAVFSVKDIHGTQTDSVTYVVHD